MGIVSKGQMGQSPRQTQSILTECLLTTGKSHQQKSCVHNFPEPLVALQYRTTAKEIAEATGIDMPAISMYSLWSLSMAALDFIL